MYNLYDMNLNKNIKFILIISFMIFIKYYNYKIFEFYFITFFGKSLYYYYYY